MLSWKPRDESSNHVKTYKNYRMSIHTDVFVILRYYYIDNTNAQ